MLGRYKVPLTSWYFTSLHVTGSKYYPFKSSYGNDVFFKTGSIISLEGFTGTLGLNNGWNTFGITVAGMYVILWILKVSTFSVVFGMIGFNKSILLAGAL